MPERESLCAKEMAQVANLNLATEIARLQMEGLSLDIQTKKETLAREHADDYYNRVYNFTALVDERSVGVCINVLSTWSRLWPGKEIEIVIHSPGGDALAGLALFDYIGSLRGKGHGITTVAMGFAASMAGILLQAGSMRLIGRESYVLIHEISGSAVGRIGEIEDTITFANKMQERMINIFLGRSGGKMTRANFVKHWKRKDWWLDSSEMLRYGFVDGIR